MTIGAADPRPSSLDHSLGEVGSDLEGTLVRLPPPALRLLEPIGSGPRGRTWSATLGDGSLVSAKRLLLDAQGSAAVTHRIEQACGLRRRQLASYRAAIADADGLWVVADWDAGVPLSELPSRMRAACVLAVGLGVLKALAVLHQEGMWHGSLNAGNVLVGADGSIRLAHYGLAPADPEQAPAHLQRADLLAARSLLCGLLGIPANPATDGKPSPRAARTPLGMAILSIAGKPKRRPIGYEASIAAVALWESGGAMATTRRQAKARELLAAMVESARERPDTAAPALPSAPAPSFLALPANLAAVEPAAAPASKPAPTIPPGPGPRRRIAWGATIALPTLLLAAWVLQVAPGPRSIGAGSPEPPAQHQLAAASRAEEHQTPGAEAPSPPPSALAELPASGAGIHRIEVALNSGMCLPGAECSVRVDVWIEPSRARRLVSWSLQVTDLCQPQTTILAANSVGAQAGWNHVTAYSQLILPAGQRELLRAVTELPGRAASPALEVSARPAC